MLSQWPRLLRQWARSRFRRIGEAVWGASISPFSSLRSEKGEMDVHLWWTCVSVASLLSDVVFGDHSMAPHASEMLLGDAVRLFMCAGIQWPHRRAVVGEDIRRHEHAFVAHVADVEGGGSIPRDPVGVAAVVVLVVGDHGSCRFLASCWPIWGCLFSSLSSLRSEREEKRPHLWCGSVVQASP